MKKRSYALIFLVCFFFPACDEFNFLYFAENPHPARIGPVSESVGRKCMIIGSFIQKRGYEERDDSGNWYTDDSRIRWKVSALRGNAYRTVWVDKASDTEAILALKCPRRVRRR